MNLNNIPVKGARALMLGITFKEIYPVKCEAFYYGDCPDTSEAKSRTRFGIRNTKAIDIYHELKEYGMEVDVYDPCLSPELRSIIHGPEPKDLAPLTVYGCKCFCATPVSPCPQQ